MHPNVFCSPIYSWKDMETSIDGWTDKKDMRNTHTHTHTQHDEIPLSHKKKEILPSATTWMDPESFMLNWNKSIRERLVLYDFTYIWNLENKANA